MKDLHLLNLAILFFLLGNNCKFFHHGKCTEATATLYKIPGIPDQFSFFSSHTNIVNNDSG